MKRIHWLALLLLLAGTAFVVYQQHTAPYRHASGNIFGTTYNITYQSSEPLEEEIIKALNSVDASLSMFNQESTLARINRGEDVMLDHHLSYLLPRAQKISEKTSGAFDITVAPLVNAWGFGFKNDSLPSQHVIDSIRQFVGYNTIRIKDERIQKDDQRTMIDLSAIAKGYGADMVAQMLEKAKVQNYMVEIGGEVVVKGENEKGGKWRIGIAHPTENPEEQQGYECVLPLTDCAMATSGNYRNYRDKDGKHYAHTIDPRTGQPIQHDVISATVLARHCFEADAYATSFMVLGLEKAKKIVEESKQLKAYLIYIDKNGEQKTWSNIDAE